MISQPLTGGTGYVRWTWRLELGDMSTITLIRLPAAEDAGVRGNCDGEKRVSRSKRHGHKGEKGLDDSYQPQRCTVHFAEIDTLETGSYGFVIVRPWKLLRTPNCKNGKEGDAFSTRCLSYQNLRCRVRIIVFRSPCLAHSYPGRCVRNVVFSSASSNQ